MPASEGRSPSGTNGGAQEHLYSLLTRIDRSRYEASVVSLSPGSAVRKLQRAGIQVVVIDDPDDAVAVGALAVHLAAVRPDVIHNHMYRAELVGTRAAIALEKIGLRRPYVVSTVHSSRVRSAEDREQLRRLTPHMDRLIAVSHAMEQKIADEGRDTAPVTLVYNGVDPDARELSPGVVMVTRYIERAIAAGKRRLDFLRGDEPYKYVWGAVDEPIQRILVRRRVR